MSGVQNNRHVRKRERRGAPPVSQAGHSYSVSGGTLTAGRSGSVVGSVERGSEAIVKVKALGWPLAPIVIAIVPLPAAFAYAPVPLVMTYVIFDGTENGPNPVSVGPVSASVTDPAFAGSVLKLLSVSVPVACPASIASGTKTVPKALTAPSAPAVPVPLKTVVYPRTGL